MAGIELTRSLKEAGLKIKERKRDGVAILEMSGKLMGGPDAERVRRDAQDAHSRGRQEYRRQPGEGQLGQQHGARVS